MLPSTVAAQLQFRPRAHLGPHVPLRSRPEPVFKTPPEAGANGFPEQAGDCTPETEAQRGEIEEAVASAIRALPETQREVLLLAHYEHLSLAEIAQITELEVTAVKSRLQRARSTLRETLAAYAPRVERTL